MSIDDPFFSSDPGDDRTVIRPMPGARRSDLPQGHTQAPSAPLSDRPPPHLGRLNPLENAASGLLALLTQLNHSRQHPDADGLRSRIIKEIQHFQTEAISKNIDQETVYAARYVLCTTLDEAVLNTPWGSNSGWSQKNLLSTFHKEVSGGERFFQLLKSFGQNPSKNLYILELMYLCLALGFKGRYRIVNGGMDKLAQIREWLYQLIRKQKGEAEKALSPHWRGVTDKRSPLIRFIPTWVFGAAAIALLALLFSALLLHLNRLSDPVFSQVFGIKAAPPRIIQPTPDLPPPPIIVPETKPLTLSILLAKEIKQNKVKVEETDLQDKAIIRSDNLFPPGRATVNQNIIPLLHRIGKSLNQLEGQVLVIGHTDSDPISTARFPSNWHLSLARANAVAEILKQDLDDPARILTEGRADLEPVAANTTAAGKAKNRRVEVVLLK